MVIRVIQPSSDRALIEEDGTPTQQANSWFKTITDRSIIIGKGSPEAAVEANNGSMYMDSTGATGSVLYIKRDADVSGDKTKGWFLV